MTLNLHFSTPRRSVENVSSKFLSVKSFGAANDETAIKKTTALLDVKNTLHKKTYFGATKPSGATNKADIKGDFLKVFGDKENVKVGKKHLMKPNQTKQTQHVLSEAIGDLSLDEENIPPSCQCHEECEDEFADIMFKHLKPSKAQVEDLALNWGNPPIVGVNDMRDITTSLKPIDCSEMFDVLFTSFQEDDFGSMEMNDVPPPFFF